MDKHTLRVKIARKIRSREELKAKVSIFDTKAWEKQKQEKADRVKRTEKRQKEASRMAKERRINGKNN